jgi:diaminohydroxyphosphoribosylaminopyrimidine deaminase/5-amino-6-(5-phosphoribosylamino)uracil reductase
MDNIAKTHPGYGFGGFISRTIAPELLAGSQQPAPAAPVSLDHEDEKWMHTALLAAMDRVGVAPPNPIVGCTLVKDGKMLASGATDKFGGLHGERIALAEIKDSALTKGATAYVTLEPCSHHGKQPPCTDALIAAGISRCVIATADPFHLVAGQGITALKNAGIEVKCGVLKTESILFNYPFFASQFFKRPIFIGKWAQTLDGHLADDAGSSKWISSAASRSHTHWLRQKYDAIMVGGGTLIRDIPALTARNCAAPINRQPLRVVFDPRAQFLKADPAMQQKIIASTFDENSKTIYCCTHDSWNAFSALLSDAHLFRAPHTRLILLDAADPLGDLVQKMGGDEFSAMNNGLAVQSVMVEGGASLLNLMLCKDLLDACQIFIAPALLGGVQNRIGQNSLSKIAPSCFDMRRLHLIASNQIDNDILAELVPEDRWQKIFC